MSILIAVAIILVAFYLLAIITDGFFVPAIDRISKKLRLSSDAAGATLLAAGSSAPEFFISLIAILGLAGHGSSADIGAGAIVGSAIFNVLVIIGVAATFKSVTLQWQPVARDQGFYIITIILLLFAFFDGKIVLYEALVFVFAYIIYVLTVANWRKFLDYKDVPAPKDEKGEEKNAVVEFTYDVLGYVIPRPKQGSSLYWLTFIFSILGIGLLSYLLVQQVIVIGEELSINPTFLALTVLAAGTSIPDLIGSVIVARQGRGDMAVSNAIGSNIFDILFGLGVPWLIFLIFKGNEIVVGTENLFSSVALLFATVISIVVLLKLRKWRIGPKSGFLLIGLYVAYLLYIMVTVA